MNSKTSSERFRQAVNICNRFIGLKPTLPILANIKIESERAKLKLTATNLENSIVIQIPASGEVWETTIPAKLLVEFLNLIRSEDTKISLEKEKVTIVCGEVEGSFNTIAASEFPHIPQDPVKGTTINQSDLFGAVKNIAFAASSDEGKPVLNGILIRSKNNKTTLVATDSYRLAQHEFSTDYDLEQIIVPAKTFAESIKIAGELGEELIDLSVSKSSNQIFVVGEGFQITARLIDGVYPAFEQIIPTEFVCKVLVEKDAIISAIKQAAVFARDLGNVVKIFVTKEGGLRVWGSTKQVGEGSSKIQAEVNGEELEVAFNSHFLLEGVEAVSGKQATLEFSGSLKPAKIIGDNEKEFNYIVMPVRPQN